MKVEDIKELSREAYEFLSKALREGCENGRYELSGGAYVNVSTYKTAPREEKLFEAHRKFIDIQMVISGNELVCIESLEDMQSGKCVMEYSEKDDAELYVMNSLGKDVPFGEGDVLVFYPEDAHAPGIMAGSPSEVHKAVVKLPVAEQ